MYRSLRAILAAGLFALSSLLAQQAYAQAVQTPPGEACFQATTGINGMLGTLGTITGGSGGTSGTYTAALTGGSGTGATASLTVSGGAVTQVAIQNPGINYVVGDSLSATSSTIGNVTGFSVPVASISINSSLAGGTVGMYMPGTLTYSQTWQDAGQTIQNTNPIKLDANGCALIYGIGTYRQILYDSLGNEVWDQLTSVAPINPYWAGNAGGTANVITLTDASFAGVNGQTVQFIATATNTGSVTINPSSFGAIPGVKNTSSGPIALSGGEIVTGNLVTVTYGASAGEFFLQSTPYVVPTVVNAVPNPGGRLTLVSGTPVMTSTVTGQSTIYYAPYKSQFVPIYNGASLQNYQFTSGASDIVGQSITLGSSWSANTVFDVFDTLVAGTPTLCTMQWTSPTARNVALAIYNGIYTNSISANCQTSNTNSVTVAANQGTYLGSFYTNASSGQVDFNLGGSASGGSAASLGLWNFYNQVIVLANVEDTSGTYSYNGGLRQANASAGNQVNFIVGLAEKVNVTFMAQNRSSTGGAVQWGIGLNSITAQAFPLVNVSDVGGQANNFGGPAVATLTISAGNNYVAALESTGTSGSATFNESSDQTLQLSLQM